MIEFWGHELKSGAPVSWTAPVLWRFFRDRENAGGLAQSKTWRQGVRFTGHLNQRLVLV